MLTNQIKTTQRGLPRSGAGTLRSVAGGRMELAHVPVILRSLIFISAANGAAVLFARLLGTRFARPIDGGIVLSMKSNVICIRRCQFHGPVKREFWQQVSNENYARAEGAAANKCADGSGLDRSAPSRACDAEGLRPADERRPVRGMGGKMSASHPLARRYRRHGQFACPTRERGSNNS